MSELFSNPQRYAAAYSAPSPDGEFYRARLALVSGLLDRHLPVAASGPHQRRLLDVGCGPGMLVEPTSRRQIRFVGIDLSFPMASACHQRLQASRSGQVACGSVETLPFSGETFDAVMCMGVLEYLRSIHATLREIGRVLKADGLLLASMLNPLSPYRMWERWTQPRLCKLSRPFVHAERTLGSLIEACGFRVLEYEYFDFNVLLPPLDQRCPRASAAVNRILSKLAHTPLRKLGTGFVAVARKGRVPAGESPAR